LAEAIAKSGGAQAASDTDNYDDLNKIQAPTLPGLGGNSSAGSGAY